MAAACSVNVIAELTGLGKVQEFIEKFAVTTVPTAATYNYRIQATSATEEALDLGDVSTVELIIIKCVATAMTIDTSFSSSYNSEITLAVGEVAVFKPSGTVYINSAGTATYEYLCLGTS